MHLKKSYSSSNNAHSAPSYPIPSPEIREKKKKLETQGNYMNINKKGKKKDKMMGFEESNEIKNAS